MRVKNKNKWSYSVVVSTPDFESGILGSNPCETIICFLSSVG